MGGGFAFNGLTPAALTGSKVSFTARNGQDLQCMLDLKKAYSEFKEVDSVKIYVQMANLHNSAF